MTFELYAEWLQVASLKDDESRIQSLRDTCSRLPHESYNNLRCFVRTGLLQQPLGQLFLPQTHTYGPPELLLPTGI